MFQYRGLRGICKEGSAAGNHNLLLQSAAESYIMSANPIKGGKTEMKKTKFMKAILLALCAALLMNVALAEDA